MRRHAARRQDEQRELRRRRNERAFLFDPGGRCVGEAERDEWELLVSACGGDVVKAAAGRGLNVPKGTKALWGRSQQAAMETYRRWQKQRRPG
jgi:hypothetical protein